MNYEQFKKEFPHGCKVSFESYEGKHTDAKISHNEDGISFICQNQIRGLDADDKLGYKYSLTVFKEGERWGGENGFRNDVYKIERIDEKLTKEHLLDPKTYHLDIKVHARTKEEASQFMYQMHKFGKKWNGGNCPLDDCGVSGIGYWEDYKEKTGYYLKHWMEDGGQLANVSRYNEGCKIITVKEYFEILEEKPKKIKEEWKSTHTKGIYTLKEDSISIRDKDYTPETLKQHIKECSSGMRYYKKFFNK